MAKCKLSGRKPVSGNNVPFSQKKTKRVFRPNIQSKAVFVPELGRSVRIKMSTSAMRTVDKIGLMAYLKKQGLRLEDVVQGQAPMSRGDNDGFQEKGTPPGD